MVCEPGLELVNVTSTLKALSHAPKERICSCMRLIKVASKPDLVSSKKSVMWGSVFSCLFISIQVRVLSFTTSKLTANSHGWSLVQLQQQTEEKSV